MTSDLTWDMLAVTSRTSMARFASMSIMGCRGLAVVSAETALDGTPTPVGAGGSWPEVPPGAWLGAGAGSTSEVAIAVAGWSAIALSRVGPARLFGLCGGELAVTAGAACAQ